MDQSTSYGRCGVNGMPPRRRLLLAAHAKRRQACRLVGEEFWFSRFDSIPFENLGPQSISYNASVSRLFGIDYRALKIFRVGLALLVLGDLFARSMDLDAFYTDAGVLPRALLRIPRFRFSAHAMTGGRGGEEIMFLLAAAFALLLLIGIWPRLAAVASWLFMASLDARNPLVLNHGDELLKIFLFWSIFVPLSSDSRLSPDGTGRRHLSIFSVALTIQVCIVYFFGALLKTDPSWRVSGTAIYAALGLEQLSTGLGRSLLDWPRLLRIATLCVYYLELLGPLLLFVPWENRRIREAAIVAFVAVHLGIAATMNLGLFPWVSILGWVLILPSETLDSLQRVMKWEPAARTPMAVEAPKVSALQRIATLVLGVYLLLAVLVWNVRTLDLKTEEVNPGPFDCVLLMAQLDQRWNMFAPKPNYISGWFVAPADLADGSQVDLLKAGQPYSLKRPDVVAATFPNSRWRKYLINLSLPRFERYRQALSPFLRGRWDRAHPENLKIERLTVYFVWQHLARDGVSPVRTTVISTD